jgi:hypothetical protein
MEKKLIMFAIVNSENKFIFEGNEGFYYTKLRPACLMNKEKADSIKNYLDDIWKNGNFDGETLYLNPDNDDQYDENLKVMKVELKPTIIDV